MKTKIIVHYPEKCTGCLACEKACSQVHFKTQNGGEESAIRIEKKGDKFEATVCNHCGLCIDMCPVQALKRTPKGTVLLNKNICIGCQACVGFCPRGVMRRASARVEPFKCIACGSCVRACPEGALELVEVELDDIEEMVYIKQGVEDPDCQGGGH